MEHLTHLEDYYHKPFDEHELGFDAKTVVNFTILRCRDFVFEEKIGVLVQLRVASPQLTNASASEIAEFTSAIRLKSGDTEINECFKFVLPDNFNESFSFVINVCKNGKIVTSFGKITIKMSDDQTSSNTYQFDKTSGKVDVSFETKTDYLPDFRLGFGLNEEEKKFRLKRLPKAFDAMKNLLEDDEDAPQAVEETPVISVVGSGGGYRAMIGMSGAMAALQDAGVMDALTYVSGLSGSAWYLTTAYAREGVHKENQQSFHDDLREIVGRGLIKSFFSPSLFYQYVKMYIKWITLYNSRITFVNYFGYMLGYKLLGEQNLEKGLSHIQDYIKDANVPYPSFIALHVKDADVPANSFHAYMENTPYEVGFPDYAISLPVHRCGSIWNEGFTVRQCPELYLHFYQGICGSAFAILLKTYVKEGGEDDKKFREYIDNMRETKVEEEVEEEKPENQGMFSKMKNWFTNTGRTIKRWFSDAGSAIKNWFIMATVNLLLKFEGLWTKRGFFLTRTGKIFNFARFYYSIQGYFLNPFVEERELYVYEEEVHKLFGPMKAIPIDVKEKEISVCDAGILKNVCVEAVMRPQRTPDLVLVMDFNAYDSDDFFNYQPLFDAAAQAWRQGIRFPPVDFKDVANRPPEELLIFESDDDECPTVLWFTLCNRKFKNLKDYKPRFGQEEKSKKPFNDFPVYGKGSKYGTFHFAYGKDEFNKLHELMYFNVMSNIEVIKEQISKAVARKRRRIAEAQLEEIKVLRTGSMPMWLMGNGVAPLPMESGCCSEPANLGMPKKQRSKREIKKRNIALI